MSDAWHCHPPLPAASPLPLSPVQRHHLAASELGHELLGEHHRPLPLHATGSIAVLHNRELVQDGGTALVGRRGKREAGREEEREWGLGQTKWAFSADQQTRKHWLRAASCSAFGSRMREKTQLCSSQLCVLQDECVCLPAAASLLLPAHQCVCPCVGDGHDILTADLLHRNVALEVGLRSGSQAGRQAWSQAGRYT